MKPTLQTKPKKSRVSTQKVRTGCITCKKRHVKCDETKPHCINCLKARGHCEGYDAKPSKIAAGPVQLCWDSKRGAHHHRAAPRMAMIVDPDSLGFRDETALLCFQEFVGLVQGPWIRAASSHGLWDVTLPQLARNNDVLRSAATAIGALSLWHRRSGCTSLRAVAAPESPAAEQDTHYFYAVAYYCHSIKLQNQRASPQDAVFLSLLLLFFERLRGNRQAALDHVNHGLTLLLSLLTDKDTHPQAADLGPDPKPLLEAVADIFTHLATQARTVLRGRIGQGPSLPNLERELRNKEYTMESFMLLLSQLPRSHSANDQIPAVFESLDEFEEYWSNCHRRQAKIISVMTEIIQSSGIRGSKDNHVIDGFFSALLGNHSAKLICEDSQKEIQALDAAFLPLFNKIIMSDAQSPAYLRAIHLRLQCLASYVLADPVTCMDVDILSSRTPSFRQYLSLAEVALRMARREIGNPAHHLSLHCGLAWNLLIASLFCRDPLTRDEAVGMLRDYPGQDGLWNTRSLYALALKNRDIEWMNAQEGTPTEQWRRLWRREFVFEEGGNRIVLRYLYKDQGPGIWQLIEEAAEVGPNSEDVHWTRQPLTGSGGMLVGDLYSPETTHTS